ncbi:hypothetical protein [Ammoniphilus sp. 3BR4]|uniref:hypothetical protein n=1 Tax=Ammoniphilus sp. 3BR4 TaxID=3158265 RepID=UPI003467C091
MRYRDQAILSDLQRFRVMSRDDIVEIHFHDVKEKIKGCNTVLKRLREKNLIQANTKHRPYLYFPNPSTVKINSQKLNHFLAILKFYRELREFSLPSKFEVEAKFGPTYMEPDIFMIWEGNPYFVEIQRSYYSPQKMREKLNRYIRYYQSNEWQNSSWQHNPHCPVFPTLWMITDIKYPLQFLPFRIVQSVNVVNGVHNLNIQTNTNTT